MRRKISEGYIGFTQDDTRCIYEDELNIKVEKNRPNVVYIVLDDLGFAQLGCYGSDIETPNLDRLANEGLRYNNFHTTAICSATRASLLTGMNNHTAGVNATMEFLTKHNNGIGHLHKDCATLAEILKQYGYGTYAAGKWHLTEHSETTPAGPFDNWPLGKGFDRYYGFLQAQMDQYNPRLVQDNTHVNPPKSAEEGYHFSEDITDKAIDFIYNQQKAYPEKPFFLYLAYGAMHAPHHAPKSYIDAYKGKFDEGWDVKREKWFENQKKLGIIPADAKLTPRNELVKPWDALSDNEKKIAARYMEVFAGMLTHTDEQIGRLVSYLEKSNQLDNTIIVFISDNGASAEGGELGRYNSYDDGASDEYVLEHLDDIGSPNSYNHYPIGWANAGNTPFRWYKMFTYSGGVKDPMIVRYPAGIKNPGKVCAQYHHVSDITPTILDVLGEKKPEYIKGVKQKDFQGISFAYTFDNSEAKDKKHVQHFEMLGNRAIYKDGWKAIVNHARNASGGAFEDDKWELYHVEEDYSEYEDVADKYPEKVDQLEKDWFIEAAKADVFPLLNGTLYGSTKEMANLIEHVVKNERLETYYDITKPVDILRTFFSVLNNKSHEVSAEIELKKDDKGVIISIGNRFSGYSLFIKDNKLFYSYNKGGIEWYTVVSSEAIGEGTHKVSFRLKVNKNFSGLIEVFLDGNLIGDVIVPQLNDNSDAVATIGGNKHTSVVPGEYKLPYDFTGTIKRLDIKVAGYTQNLDEELEEFFSRD